MADNLLPFERRMEIMFMIISRRKITRRKLAKTFSVSDDVIDRDIVVLNKYIPIDIKRGRYGGIVLSKEYDGIRIYMNNKEEAVVIKCMQYVNEKEKRTLNSILHKFAMPKKVKE